MREKRYEKQIDRNRQSKALSQLCKEHRLGFVELESRKDVRTLDSIKLTA